MLQNLSFAAVVTGALRVLFFVFIHFFYFSFWGVFFSLFMLVFIREFRGKIDKIMYPNLNVDRN